MILWDALPGSGSHVCGPGRYVGPVRPVQRTGSPGSVVYLTFPPAKSFSKWLCLPMKQSLRPPLTTRWPNRRLGLERDISSNSSAADTTGRNPNGTKRRKRNCSGRDLNPHAFRHTPLKRTCLPFHHPSLCLAATHQVTPGKLISER